MHEDTSTPAPARPGASLVCGVIAAAGAAAMGLAIPTLHDLLESSQGHETLIAWVLLGLAVMGTLLCAYLALVWGLAVMILLAGPASRTGAAVLVMLRVLAPRLARRLVGGAAVATATTALTLAPGLAAQGSLSTGPDLEPAPLTQSAELDAGGTEPADTAAEASAPEGGAAERPDTSPRLPPLGWDGDPGTSPAGAASGGSDVASGSGTSGPSTGAPTSRGPAQLPVRTVVVDRGDSLWSISDELLGPAPSDPEDIAAAWPLLHEANRDLLGEDPDLLEPGQELTVPSALTPQDTP